MFLEKLPPELAARLKDNRPPPITTVPFVETNADLAELLAVLPPETVDRLTTTLPELPPETSPREFPDNSSPRYCLIECPDGESPLMRLYVTAEAMCDRIRDLDGTDTYVFPIFGIPCQFTRGPNRILILPHDMAIQITPATVMIDLLTAPVDIERSGFLGPPELAIVTDTKAMARRRQSVKPEEEPDDDTEAVAD